MDEMCRSYAKRIRTAAAVSDLVELLKDRLPDVKITYRNKLEAVLEADAGYDTVKHVIDSGCGYFEELSCPGRTIYLDAENDNKLDVQRLENGKTLLSID